MGFSQIRAPQINFRQQRDNSSSLLSHILLDTPKPPKLSISASPELLLNHPKAEAPSQETNPSPHKPSSSADKSMLFSPVLPSQLPAHLELFLFPFGIQVLTLLLPPPATALLCSTSKHFTATTNEH